jgi:hypothetical protein
MNQLQPTTQEIKNRVKLTEEQMSHYALKVENSERETGGITFLSSSASSIGKCRESNKETFRKFY